MGDFLCQGISTAAYNGAAVRESKNVPRNDWVFCDSCALVISQMRLHNPIFDKTFGR